MQGRMSFATVADVAIVGCVEFHPSRPDAR
jgi:hypothetical protein